MPLTPVTAPHPSQPALAWPRAGICQKQMEQMANQITNYNNVVNNTKNVQPGVNVGDIHITCPGVTSYEVMREVKTQINNEVRGLHNYADQQSRIR